MLTKNLLCAKQSALAMSCSLLIIDKLQGWQ